MRVLDREADIETRFGGGFVQSIDGVSGGFEAGRSVDWFFYVDGVESSIGAAEADVEPGTRIWWDHHDWTDVMRVPAVVGSWPAPFTGGEPVSVACADPGAAACADVTGAIESAGGEVAGDGAEGSGPRVVVGAWEEIRDDREAAVLEGPPSRSGVFARIAEQGDGWRISAYDDALAESAALGPQSGLVAALEGSGDAPTWVVTGTDEAGAELAAAALDEATLANRFAVALSGGDEPLSLPTR